MRRVLAVLGAGAMIGLALLIRGVFIDGDGVDLGGGNGGGGGGPTHVICATELEAACESLADEDDGFTFEVEDAGDTAARLTDPEFDAREADVDAWLTLEPWPGLVEIRRGQAQSGPAIEEPSEVLASSALAVLGPEERLTALAAACDDEITWTCLGDIAGEEWDQHGGEGAWRDINVGYATPTRHAAGLVVLGQAASDYFGTTEFASNDFDAAFRSWLRDLDRADPGVQGTLTPLEETLRFAGSWDGVGDLDAAGRGNLEVAYPSPMIRAEVVLAPLVGHETGVDEGELATALEDAGFETGAGDGVAGPGAGVYAALVAEWELATR